MTSKKRKMRHGSRSGQATAARRGANDPAIYIGFILVGAFIVFLVYLADPGISWQAVALGYCMALAVLIHLYAVSAYRGRRLETWQKSLARIPLRFAGYGRRGGKPIEASHGSPKAKMVIFVSVAVSVAILLGLSALLIPGFVAG